MASATLEANMATDPRDEVARLHAAEREMTTRLIQLRAEIEAAKPAAAEATLRAQLAGTVSTTSSQAAKSLARLREEAERLDAAVDLCRERRAQAIPAVYRHEAAGLREQAATIRVEADERRTKSMALLQELQDLEGVRFNAPAAPPPMMRAGIESIYPLPKSQLQREEADKLAMQAAVIEGRPVARQGTVDAPDVDSLLAMLADPMVIAPRLDNVREWATRRSAAALEHSHGRRPIATLRLVWGSGVIDEAASRVALQPEAVDRSPGEGGLVFARARA
jgi:hypothetical protein